MGNLDFKTTKEDLSALLSEVGEIVDVYLPSDRATGKPRGFAFVQFSTEQAAAEAIEKFNGHDLGGRPLRINPAEENRRRPGGGAPPSRPRPSFARGVAPDFRVFDSDDRPSRPKGSRRGLRRKKRSL